MRIVVFPVISSRFVPAAPSLNFVRAMVRNVHEKWPDAVFYVVLPEDSEGSGWEYGEMPEMARTHILKMPMYRSQFDDLYLVTREFWERFNERHGDLWFDVILNERPSLAPMLRRLAAFHIEGKSRRPTVVNRAQIVMKKEWFKLVPEDELMEVVGYASAPTIYQSDHQMHEAIRIARKYLTPAQVQHLISDSYVFPLGIDCDDVRRIITEDRGPGVERERFPDITVNYSHKLFTEQRFLESLEIMDKTLAGGRQIDLQIVTGSSEMKMTMMQKARKYRHMRFVGKASRQTFLKEMSKAHVFVSNSVYEDFSATVVEQMYAGLIPVLIDKPWSRYLVPDGYPFLFQNPTEGGAFLRYVIDNWEAVADEWVPKIRAKIEERFDLGSIAVAMYELLQDVRMIDLTNQRCGPGMGELIDEVWDDLPPVFGVQDISDAVRARSKTMDLDRELESHSTSRWLFVDQLLLRHPGWRDRGTLVPTWSKED